MSAPSDLAKQLRVAVSVATRTKKEVTSYERETSQQAEKVAKMEAGGADEYDVRKQVECLEESRQMISDTKRRYNDAIETLRAFAATHGSKSGIAGTPQLAQALEMVREADDADDGAAAGAGAGADEEDL